MPTTSPEEHFRNYTSVELGVFVRLSRDLRGWTQEHLASLADLSTADILEMEEGNPANLEVQKRVARLFGVQDLDELRVPLSTEAALHKEFGTHVKVDVLPVESGLHLAKLLEHCDVVWVAPGFPMQSPLGQKFEELATKVHSYLGTWNELSEVQRGSLHQTLQIQVAQLESQGISLCYGTRSITSLTHATSPVEALYVVGYMAGFEPDHFMAPRRIQMP